MYQLIIGPIIILIHAFKCGINALDIKGGFNFAKDQNEDLIMELIEYSIAMVWKPSFPLCKLESEVMTLNKP